MAAAADAGHRVVLIVATGGEEGEVAADAIALLYRLAGGARA